MTLFTRYQAVIIQNDRMLLVKQGVASVYSWWNVPGGGLQYHETEEACVLREVKEETNLDVRIERLLIDGPSHPHSQYQHFKTYLCVCVGGHAEPDGNEITAIKWFDLKDETQLSLKILNNETTYDMVQRIRKALGYT